MNYRSLPETITARKGVQTELVKARNQNEENEPF
jgi:hypothetical protein